MHKDSFRKRISIPTARSKMMNKLIVIFLICAGFSGVANAKIDDNHSLWLANPLSVFSCKAGEMAGNRVELDAAGNQIQVDSLFDTEQSRWGEYMRLN